MILYILLVVGSVLTTLVASYIHHRFVMGVRETEFYQYIVPFMVGVAFGVILSMLAGMHSSLKEKERELKELASTDPLTGLPNKREILNYLSKEVDIAKRKGSPLSVAVLDLDNFKQINDTYGHMVGDRVLKHLAGILRRNLRSSDMVGRFGGEEFVVVMKDTDLETAHRVMDRIRREVELANIEPVGSISVSIGVAELGKEEGSENLIIKADERLYRAKMEGKNRVVSA